MGCLWWGRKGEERGWERGRGEGKWMSWAKCFDVIICTGWPRVTEINKIYWFGGVV